MQETFRDLGVGMILAVLLMYFLMVALDKSYIVPLTVMLTVPICLAGVLPMLYFTGTAINVQSILGIIFIIGIKVANTVLMTDFAQEIRRHEGLTPTEAIRKAASVRVRPVTMTALAAFFAMIPAAMALERGSEANAPLGPRHPRRPAGRRAGHAVRPALPVLADGPRPEGRVPGTSPRDAPPRGSELEAEPRHDEGWV